MCSYCGCRNIPMIAKLNAEHDAIVNSTYALQIAFRDQDVDSSHNRRQESSANCCTRTPTASRSASSPKWRRTNCSPSTSPHCAPNTTELDADLAAIDAGDLTRIPTMITLLNNHIDREENGLFPAALAYLDDDQWEIIQRPELMEE